MPDGAAAATSRGPRRGRSAHTSRGQRGEQTLASAALWQRREATRWVGGELVKSSGATDKASTATVPGVCVFQRLGRTPGACS
eukprot:6079080-Prymnesium_polylepis.1